MASFRSLVFTAALAGLICGLFLALAQQMLTVPLILEAEVFENAAPAAGAAHEHAPGTAAHDHGDDAEAWAPSDGFERIFYTVIADIVTGIGFALLLLAAFRLAGRPIGWRRGLLWGLAGFLTFMVAPSLGLPPELPGMPAAELGPRQLWWILTVAATGIGLALILLHARPWTVVLALVLILLPHLIGAPLPPDEPSLVPETLAHRFVVAVTVTSFAFWALLGVLTGILHGRRVGAEPGRVAEWA